MGIYGTAAGVLALVKSVATGSRVRHFAREMEAAERLVPDALADLQWQRLKPLLRHAVDHVPFYRARFEAAGLGAADFRSIEDLGRIPVLDRSAVQQHRDALRSELPGTRLELNWTGGSSGAPLRFWQDPQCREYGQAAMLRIRGWHGIARGDRMAFIWPTLRDQPAWSVRERLRHRLTRQRWFSAATLTTSEIEHIVQTLRVWRPRVIVSWPSCLHAVARHILGRGIGDLRLVAVESWSERILDHEREDVQAAFGCGVVDVYASREFYPMAAQCERLRGHHVASDLRVIELLDDRNRPVAPGMPGRVIVTDLTNYAMPFIRYDTGDVAVWAADGCSCGRALPVLSSIEGRMSDVFRRKDGAWMNGGMFTAPIVKAGGVAAFQAHQISTETVIVRLVPLAPGVQPPIDKIRHGIHAAIGDVFDLRFEIVDDIPRLPSGKRRFTISDVATTAR